MAANGRALLLGNHAELSTPSPMASGQTAAQPVGHLLLWPLSVDAAARGKEEG